MKTRASYTHSSQLPDDPEIWGDAEYAFFWAQESHRYSTEGFNAKTAVIKMLQAVGEPITPATWEMLIPLLAIRLGVPDPELEKVPDEIGNLTVQIEADTIGTTFANDEEIDRHPAVIAARKAGRQILVYGPDGTLR